MVVLQSELLGVQLAVHNGDLDLDIGDGVVHLDVDLLLLGAAGLEGDEARH